MAALESAMAHLHALALAYNDINQENIMVGEDSLSVLVDLRSCQAFGKRMLTQSTAGWIETMDLHSKREHDVFVLQRIWSGG